MVFFTCNACGESVKKIQVEKHVSVCRNCECLSCIDCGKDFWGDDYKNHVKCISEDQKYGGKGYEGKTHKGDIKQQAWIQNWMKNSLKVHNESILDQVWNIFSEASNSEPVNKEQDQQPLHPVANPHAEISTKVPASKVKDAMEQQGEVKKNKRERKEERQKKRKREKKEVKLENHQENSRNPKPKKREKGQEADLEAGGEEVPEADGSAGKRSKKKQQHKDSASEEEAHVDAGRRKRRHSEVETDSKKKKMKLPEHPEGGEPEDDEAPAKGKFNWKGTIKAILKQAPDNEITIKKLRKKVLAQYYTVTDEHHRSEEELLVIFNKKISKNPTFKLLKDRVKLVK
ncbi:cell growth-regulating nucleolar protein isoform X2 [Pan troglodytes]|uniref:cell growth-regulating nucleolar protein isoform X2 n=1 Tax=Pan troglodytes TaxID=9598 RepID=UPI0023F4C51F|nr:cell growth-regulating nucleolar protein isoform X2 [Pan troglodytes]